MSPRHRTHPPFPLGCSTPGRNQLHPHAPGWIGCRIRPLRTPTHPRHSRPPQPLTRVPPTSTHCSRCVLVPGYHGEGCGPHLPTPNFLENSPRCRRGAGRGFRAPRRHPGVSAEHEEGPSRDAASGGSPEPSGAGRGLGRAVSGTRGGSCCTAHPAPTSCLSRSRGGTGTSSSGCPPASCAASPPFCPGWGVPAPRLPPPPPAGPS